MNRKEVCQLSAEALRSREVYGTNREKEKLRLSYTDLQSLSVGEFKRLCGVSRETFGEMVEVLRPQLERQGKRGGQNKLSVEEQLLVALEYWREYRSQFHIAINWGLHETTGVHPTFAERRKIETNS